MPHFPTDNYPRNWKKFHYYLDCKLKSKETYISCNRARPSFFFFTTYEQDKKRNTPEHQNASRTNTTPLLLLHRGKMIYPISTISTLRDTLYLQTWTMGTTKENSP